MVAGSCLKLLLFWHQAGTLLLRTPEQVIAALEHEPRKARKTRKVKTGILFHFRVFRAFRG